jgi:microsomal dipeptidase-like Zn-dependent dipeptidase
MTPIIDLHCDLPVYLLMKEQATPFSKEIGVGLPFLKEGNVALQVMAIFTAVEKASSQEAFDQSVLYKKLLTDYSDHFIQAKLNFDVADSDKVGIVASLESASGLCNEEEPLDNAFSNFDRILNNVERLFYISLTHHTENRFGGGNYSTAGLKPDGEVLLEYISGKQIAIDLSHTSDALARDILDFTYKKNLQIPVIASHSNYRPIWVHPRNLLDEVAKEIIARKGVIGMNFVRAFVNNDKPEAMIDHLNYGISLPGGEDTICFGADFFFTGDVPDPERDPYYFPEHGDASKYPEILKSLKDHLTKDQIEKLAYKNVTNFIASNWK